MNRELLIALGVGLAVFAGMAHAEIGSNKRAEPIVAKTVVVDAPHHNHAHMHLFWSR